jgi:polyferredoxin
MGIDIRDGQQLECITCALCIDACDDVMTKLGKERGLISYATLADHEHNMVIAQAGTNVIQPERVRDKITGRLVEGIKLTNWRSIIRPRTIGYFIVWAAIGLGLLTALSLRTPMSISVLHDRNPLYVLMRDGAVSNGYDVKILNMKPEPRTATLSVLGLEGATLAVEDRTNITPNSVTVELAPDQVISLRAYVQMPADSVPTSQARFAFGAVTAEGDIKVQTEATFEVPGAK